MKYTVDIEIDRPREEVAALIDDPENLPKWQRGLLSIEPLEGAPREVGSTSQLTFRMGKRTMEMKETILVHDLPDEFSCTYDAKGVHNVVRNRFFEVGPGKTRWESENEFQFRGLMKILGVLMKGAFPKQSLKYMKDFKAFAEDGTDLRNAT